MKKELSWGKYRFVNLPRPMSRADYEEVCQSAVDDLKGCPDVVSLYLCGDQWLPGISDIDAIVVIREPRPIKIRAPWGLSEKARFVFMHKYGLLDVENFKNALYLLKLSPEKNRFLFGPEIAIRDPFKELPEQEYQSLQMAFVFDYLVNKMLLIPRYLKEPVLNVRHILAEIYSVTHALDMMREATGCAVADGFYRGVKELRGHWFDRPVEHNLDALVGYLTGMPATLQQIVSALDVYTREHFPLDGLPNRVVFRNEKYYLEFISDWSEKFPASFNRTVRLTNPFSGRDIFNMRFSLPSSLLFYLYALMGSVGSLSDNLVRAVSFKVEVPMNRAVQRHSCYLNRLLTDIKENGAPLSPVFPYGFFFIKRTRASRTGGYLLRFLRLLKR